MAQLDRIYIASTFTWTASSRISLNDLLAGLFRPDWFLSPTFCGDIVVLPTQRVLMLRLFPPSIPQLCKPLLDYVSAGIWDATLSPQSRTLPKNKFILTFSLPESLRKSLLDSNKKFYISEGHQFSKKMLVMDENCIVKELDITLSRLDFVFTRTFFSWICAYTSLQTKISNPGHNCCKFGFNFIKLLSTPQKDPITILQILDSFQISTKPESSIPSAKEPPNVTPTHPSKSEIITPALALDYIPFNVHLNYQLEPTKTPRL